MQWPKREAKFWEEIPFFRLLLPFAAGIALYDAFPKSFSAGLLVAISVALLLALVALSFVRRLGTAYLTVRFAVLMVFLAAGGYTLAFFHDARHSRHWIGRQPISNGALKLRISVPPKATAQTWRMEAEVLSVFNTATEKPVSGKLLLTVFKSDSLCPYAVGDTVVTAHSLQPHSGPSHPFGFDARRFYNRQNNYHQLLLSQDEVMPLGKHREAQDGLVMRMNRWAMRTLNAHVADPETRALLQAMLLGNEEYFDADLRQAYANTGVIHVVAISGSHLATLFLAFFFIPYLIRGRWGRRVQYGLGLVAVWLYVLLAGAPPSAIRAAVVFTLLAGSILLDIHHHTLNTLLAGVFFILCFQPMWLYAVGFQLSVLAVLSIVLFYPHVRKWVLVRNPVLRLLWNATAVSLCAQILVAPLSVYYFHNFPLLFLVANLVAWLLIGVIAMFGGIGVLVFAWWPALSKGIADLTAFFVHGFNRFVRLLQDWNPPSFRHLQLSLPEMLLVYLLLIGLAVWLLHRNAKAFLLAGFSLAALLGISVFNQYQALKQDRLVVYETSNRLLADRFSGKRFQSLFADLPEDSLRAVREVRTGYRAWRRSPAKDSNAVQRIAGKTVLVYRDSANRFDAPLDFPVDVLLVARPLKGLSAAQLRAAFHPGIMVAGGLDKRWRLRSWKDSCKAIGQPFYATVLDGAYVLE